MKFANNHNFIHLAEERHCVSSAPNRLTIQGHLLLPGCVHNNLTSLNALFASPSSLHSTYKMTTEHLKYLNYQAQKILSHVVRDKPLFFWRGIWKILKKNYLQGLKRQNKLLANKCTKIKLA